ncbi:MAG: hypothetical protein QG602_2329 [Verrucomicrobiota bacterium]|nr:hypothetical protein [Pseudomonadota bacterium]MDQ5979355.1 hypothetical protein [Verrucomicrobiota bacterium]
MTPYKGRVAIFTSFYSFQAYAPYCISLAQTLGVLSKLGVEWDYLARPSDFHIERAINNTLTELVEHGGFTDVLLIDSDESWEPEGVVRLLMHPQEIVAATYRMKNNPKEYVGSLVWDEGTPRGKMLPDGSALIAAERVAAGFLRIRLDALKRYMAAYPQLWSDEPDGRKFQFFQRAPIQQDDGSTVMGCQDMVFSKRWRDIGGELWIDPMVKVGHWWMECHHGDYDKHLRAQSQVSHAKEAFAVVAQMAKDAEARRVENG